MTMQRLRDETAALHAKVEGILNPDVRFATRNAYVELLQTLLPFYATCEAVLAKLPWDNIGFDVAARNKQRFLAADLKALGQSVMVAEPNTECAILIDFASGFGAMYVLEGATLGGRILRKILKSKLGIDAANGGSFYDCYGDRTEQRWKEFGAAADAYCDGSQQRQDSAVAAATATFTAFGRLLADPATDWQISG